MERVKQDSSHDAADEAEALDSADKPAEASRQLRGLLPGRLDDSFFEPLTPEELKLWTGEG